mgnify:FL=1
MANGNYAPYPDPIAPSFQSFAERQRMLIDDAIAEREAQEKRVGGVAKAGAKAGFEYDQMLRGYMEAKYANPNLTFWEYSTKPSVGGAFRAEGRKKIAAHISEGGDIKDIPGVSFGERQKAGFRGILGADKRERDARLAEIAKDEPRVQKMAEQEMSKVTSELPESQSESLKEIGKDVAGVKKIVAGRKPLEATESFKPLNPAKLLSKSPKATEAAEKSLGTIDKLIGGKKPVGVVDPQVSIGEITQAKNLSYGTDVTKLSAEAAAGIEPVAGEVAKAGAGEAGKGGLKEALGKAGTVGKGLGYAGSVAMGVKKMQSKDGTARVGGAVQTAGGVAGLVAMTNFWNPVGWAAAIPAALSIGGGLMGAGGGTDPLAGTPLGKYRRRVGIR